MPPTFFNPLPWPFCRLFIFGKIDNYLTVMEKFIHWTSPDHTSSDPSIDENSLAFACNVLRYKRFRSAYSIKFPLKTSLPYLIDNNLIEVLPNSYYLVNRGQEMECLPCQAGVEALFVNFSHILLKDVFENHHSSQKKLLDAPEGDGEPVQFFEHIYRTPSAMNQYLTALGHEMKNAGCTRSDLSPDVFFEMASLVVVEQVGVKKQIENISAVSLTTRQELYRRALAARDFMFDHWDKDLTHDEIACQAFLSPYHFHRTFKEIFGLAPMSFFKKTKLQKAKELLQTGKWTVTETAYRCGYGDVFTFSKAFKREWGVSPSECVA